MCEIKLRPNFAAIHSARKTMDTGCLKLILVLTIWISVSDCKTTANRRHGVRYFPDGFLFGTATSSYQIEGAWNEDGKSENIWDHLVHTNPSPIKDNSTGDVADDSYHKYKRDVEMLRELGVDFYRFSLSWTRLLPTSFTDNINDAGVQYYNNLIDELLKYNIEPMVTLHHFDLPQKLQEMGGWANPYIVDWYADYTRTVFELFGDKVKYWITMNEPNRMCYSAYGEGDKVAPMLNIKGRAEYMCAKNVLLAHAKAYHIYKEEFKPYQGGIIGITINADNYEPATENDIDAARIKREFTWQLYAHAIFSNTGDFPPAVKERVAAKSEAQGFLRSRLPEFSPEEVAYVRGTSDFFGLNHYSTYYAFRNESVVGYNDSPSSMDDIEVSMYQKPEWKIGESEITKYVPWGLYKVLKKIRNKYNNPPVYITENGFATHGGLTDDDRVTYHRGYLDAMLDAIHEGCDVRAYSAWNLMDNFEWTEGYTERFGLYEVDYESPERTRTPRKSAFVYKEIVRTRALDFHYEPDPNNSTMTIDEGY